MQSEEEEGNKEEDEPIALKIGTFTDDSSWRVWCINSSILLVGYHESQEIDVLYKYITHENVCVITLSLFFLWFVLNSDYSTSNKSMEESSQWAMEILI